MHRELGLIIFHYDTHIAMFHHQPSGMQSDNWQVKLTFSVQTLTEMTIQGSDKSNHQSVIGISTDNT